MVTRAAPGYLGPYRLLNVIHTGHACQIWQAYDDRKQQMVGVKAITERYKNDREQIAYLRREFEVGQTLNHPSILEVYVYGVDRGSHYMSMEWFSAPNMKQRIQQGIAKIAPLLSTVVEGAAEGLARFNARGWVHRDIKPDNFLVSDTGVVKLIDFALATRVRRGLMKWLARKTKALGTRSYISPEQLRGEVVDQRADVYSFGCTIHELISGRPPYTGANSQELLTKHVRATPPSLEAADKNVTHEFAQLVRRCLAKDPASRPPSMDDFLREFRAMRLYRVAPGTA